eukprot:Ihof_evm15s11 gene=Ihof_evmTU15s11
MPAQKESYTPEIFKSLLWGRWRRMLTCTTLLALMSVLVWSNCYNQRYPIFRVPGNVPSIQPSSPRKPYNDRLDASYRTHDFKPTFPSKERDTGLHIQADNRPPAELYYPENYQYPKTDPNKRANAAIILLTREEELGGLLECLSSFEEAFNSVYKYPYVMFNDKPFSNNFKDSISKVVFSPVTYVQLDVKKYWDAPDYVDLPKAFEQMKKMESEGVMYGGSYNYRKMCRFFSGTLFRHPEILKYDYYWRLDSSGVKFHCRVDFDPFVYMMERDMVYGFTIALHEFQNTAPTLWETTLNYMKTTGKSKPASWMNWFTDNGDTFNGHHFWSNFEIGKVSFFSGPEYQNYFDYLDREGGFFYERWGDAPVHSLGLGLFAKKHQVHWFNVIGYFHNPFSHCPTIPEISKRCHCATENQVDDIGFSSLYDFLVLEPKTIEEARKDSINVVKLLKDVLSPTKKCEKAWEVKGTGSFSVCTNPPMTQDGRCVMMSFFSVPNSEDPMDFEMYIAGTHHCSVHYFSQEANARQMEKQIQDLEQNHHSFGLRWYQMTLSHVDANTERRRVDSHLLLNEIRLKTAMQIAGIENTTVDIVKFDVEGGEWPVLIDMMESGALNRVKYLMFE